MHSRERKRKNRHSSESWIQLCIIIVSACKCRARQKERRWIDLSIAEHEWSKQKIKHNDNKFYRCFCMRSTKRRYNHFAIHVSFFLSLSLHFAFGFLLLLLLESIHGYLFRSCHRHKLLVVWRIETLFCYSALKMLRTYILHFQLKAVVAMMLQHQFPSWCCSFNALNSSFGEYDNFVTISLVRSLSDIRASCNSWGFRIYTCIYIYRAHSSCVNLDTSIHFVNSYYVYTHSHIATMIFPQILNERRKLNGTLS